MKSICKLLLWSTLTLTTPHYSYAVDIIDGKKKAVACAGCHGVNGISRNPVWPNLAGQQTGYLSLQMKNFRDGKRVNSIMNTISKSLTDEDIDNLAAYYSSL
jgi:cytochrome c553